LKRGPLPNRLGLIAGQGELAVIAARHLRDEGCEVVAVGFDEETAAGLEDVVNHFERLRLGQLGKLIKYFQGHGVDTALMVGKVHKVNIYRDIRPDGRTLRLWRKLLDRRDDTILAAFVDELAGEGITVSRADRLLRHLLAPAGKLSRRGPDRREREDIAFGWKIAKGIGRLDLGQTVVVKNRAPVAVEAMEGTDLTIRRAGELAGPGTVVVKVSKPRQDFRFDVPVVGLDTVRSLVAAGASALAVEAGKTLFVQREESLPLLRENRVALWGFTSSDFAGTH
jgi:DUF1009 family protein